MSVTAWAVPGRSMMLCGRDPEVRRIDCREGEEDKGEGEVCLGRDISGGSELHGQQGVDGVGWRGPGRARAAEQVPEITIGSQASFPYLGKLPDSPQITCRLIDNVR